MSNRDFLLEIGIEEMPARFVSDAVDQLQAKVAEWFKEQRLSFGLIEDFATPRRLALLVKGLQDKQEDIEEELRGPAKKIAQDSDGQWTKAAMGFAKGQGLTTDDLFFKTVKNQEYVFAKKFTSGQDTSELLTGLRDVIMGLTFPKNMRWGDHSFTFVRPIKWLVALYGNEVIPFEITGITTGKETQGHRFLGKTIDLETPDDYEKELLGEYVIADHRGRKNAIRLQVSSLADGRDWVVQVEDDLLEEVTQLVEYPTVFTGQFDKAFLKLPSEVLITSMREHQRYFSVEDQQGNLLPYFIGVRNGDHKHLHEVTKGNEKVLRARLSDAAFFFKEDQAIKIDDAVSSLEQVVFHENIGTMGDKVKRVEQIASKIASALKVGFSSLEVIKRGARISKFDLVTHMVDEFPELQGVMGEKYAKIQGEDPRVASTVREHYLPRNAEDAFPESTEGAIIAVADRLDTIIGCFAIGIIPSGSQDPYALRRQATGVVGIILDKQWSISLSELYTAAFDVYKALQPNVPVEAQKLNPILDDFFKLRVKNMLQDRHVPYDIIDAILDSSIDHVDYTVNKAMFLIDKHDQNEFKQLVETLSRPTNISKNLKETGMVKENLLEEGPETMLYEACVKVGEQIEKAETDQNVPGAYQALSTLVEPINHYFDKIMVMAENEAVKENRLQQMAALSKVISRFANFQKIVLTNDQQ